MMHAGNVVPIVVALVILLAGPGAADELQVADAFPVVGQETTISVPDATTHLRLIQQPDAPVAKETRVDLAGGKSYRWTPKQAGIVQIDALQDEKVLASTEVSVKFDGIPPLGVAICLIAFAILFGGAFHSLRTLLFTDDGTADEEDPPWNLSA